MKYTNDEFAELIKKMTIRTTRIVRCFLYLFSLVVGCVVWFQSHSIISLIIFFIIVIIINSIFKKTVIKQTLKNNKIETIEYVEQKIYEDRIEEKVKKNNLEIMESKYYYLDIVKIIEDKFNYYLFVTKNSCLIVSKNKIINKTEFMQILKDKCNNAKIKIK